MANNPSDDVKTKGSAQPDAASLRQAGASFMTEAVLPAFVHQSAVLAEMTAISMRLAGQFASLALGAWSVAAERSQETVRPDSADAPPVTGMPEVAPVATAMAEETVIRQAVKAADAPVAASKTASAKAKAPSGAAAVDDLKRISGIGPKLESVLKDRGVSTFRAISKLTAANAEKLDAELGLGGRILRDGWVGQAKTFLKEKS